MLEDAARAVKRARCPRLTAARRADRSNTDSNVGRARC